MIIDYLGKDFKMSAFREPIEITECRICGNTKLIEIIDLGVHYLSGVFPESLSEVVTKGPLVLVKCFSNDACCGLVQLKHSYDLTEMYGLNYGYRSGLNTSMVQHLRSQVDALLEKFQFHPGSVALDIGSNDGTTLSFFPEAKFKRIGFDPTIIKFGSYYQESIEKNADFFTKDTYDRIYKDQKVDVITSFSMLYDLETPLQFVSDVARILERNGVWIFEQSYLPTMIERNSYDTICHEHLEYYSLKQIHWMLEQCKMKIIDVTFNDVNGGSFAVVAARMDSDHTEYKNLQRLLLEEVQLGLDSLVPFKQFALRVQQSKEELLKFLADCKEKGLTVSCLGASTKGNVLLQFCGLGPSLIQSVGEVNPDKFGCFTPGTFIPIVNEKELLSSNPDYLVVLPWHFKSFFLNLPRGEAKLVFPLPVLEIV